MGRSSWWVGRVCWSWSGGLVGGELISWVWGLVSGYGAMANHAMEYIESKSLSSSEAHQVMRWVRGLPWRGEVVMLHLGWRFRRSSTGSPICARRWNFHSRSGIDRFIQDDAGMRHLRWIPVPSAVAPGQVLVAVPPIVAEKLALYSAMRSRSGGASWLEL